MNPLPRCSSHSSLEGGKTSAEEMVVRVAGSWNASAGDGPSSEGPMKSLASIRTALPASALPSDGVDDGIGTSPLVNPKGARSSQGRSWRDHPSVEIPDVSKSKNHNEMKTKMRNDSSSGSSTDNTISVPQGPHRQENQPTEAAAVESSSDASMQGNSRINVGREGEATALASSVTRETTDAASTLSAGEAGAMNSTIPFSSTKFAGVALSSSRRQQLEEMACSASTMVSPPTTSASTRDVQAVATIGSITGPVTGPSLASTPLPMKGGTPPSCTSSTASAESSTSSTIGTTKVVIHTDTESLVLQPSSDDDRQRGQGRTNQSRGLSTVAVAENTTTLPTQLLSDGSVRTTSTTTTSKQRHGIKRRHVAFSSIIIRRYPMILGDNPSCGSGPPVSLGWEYEVLPEMSVMDFEAFRLRSRRPRTVQLVLSHYKRLELLQRSGYSANEIAAADKAAARVRRQRQMSAALSPLRTIEEMAQSAGLKVKLAFRRKPAGATVARNGNYFFDNLRAGRAGSNDVKTKKDLQRTS
jgi:hypothetical protein